MRTLTLTRTIPTDRKAVWEVLADFPNIADWNRGVRSSHATGPTEGVGAARHCDFVPAGSVEEVVREWDAPGRMVIELHSPSKLPLKRATATFELAEAGDGETRVDLTYAYAPGMGPLGALLGGAFDKQFTKGFRGFLKDLEAAALNGSA